MNYRATYEENQPVLNRCQNITADITAITVKIEEMSRIDQGEWPKLFLDALINTHKSYNIPAPPVTIKDLKNVTAEFFRWQGSRMVGGIWIVDNTTQLYLNRATEGELTLQLLTNLQE